MTPLVAILACAGEQSPITSSETITAEDFAAIQAGTKLRHDPTSSSIIIGNAYYELKAPNSCRMPASADEATPSDAGVYINSVTGDAYFPSVSKEGPVSVFHFEPKITIHDLYDFYDAVNIFGTAATGGEWEESDIEQIVDYSGKLGVLASALVLDGSGYSEDLQLRAALYFVNMGEGESDYYQKANATKKAILEPWLEALKLNWDVPAAEAILDAAPELKQEVVDLALSQLKIEWDSATGYLVLRCAPEQKQVVIDVALAQLKKGYDYGAEDFIWESAPEHRQVVIDADVLQLSKAWDANLAYLISVRAPEQNQVIIDSALAQLKKDWDSQAAHYIFDKAPEQKQVAIDAAIARIKREWDRNLADLILEKAPEHKQFLVEVAITRIDKGWEGDAVDFILKNDPEQKEVMVDKALAALNTEWSVYTARHVMSYSKNSVISFDVMKQLVSREGYSPLHMLNSIADATTAVSVAELYQESLWFEDKEVTEFIATKEAECGARLTYVYK